MLKPWFGYQSELHLSLEKINRGKNHLHALTTLSTLCIPKHMLLCFSSHWVKNMFLVVSADQNRVWLVGSDVPISCSSWLNVWKPFSYLCNDKVEALIYNNTRVIDLYCHQFITFFVFLAVRISDHWQAWMVCATPMVQTWRCCWYLADKKCSTEQHLVFINYNCPF